MYLAGLPQFSSPEGDAVAQALVLSVLFIVHCFFIVACGVCGVVCTGVGLLAERA
jgi:threonine/homoserine/homoserine lactone efflux protein